MMKDPSMKEKSILDMAYEAGFKSKTTFNTIFKKHTGVTPSEFRKNLAEKPSDL
jgi:AraC-like DNA-binding protein